MDPPQHNVSQTEPVLQPLQQKITIDATLRLLGGARRGRRGAGHIVSPRAHLVNPLFTHVFIQFPQKLSSRVLLYPLICEQNRVFYFAHFRGNWIDRHQ